MFFCGNSVENVILWRFDEYVGVFIIFWSFMLFINGKWLVKCIFG